jgi:hypothetical protein
MDKWHRWGHYGCKNISKDADPDEIFVRLKDVEHLIPAEPKRDESELSGPRCSGLISEPM